MSTLSEGDREALMFALASPEDERPPVTHIQVLRVTNAVADIIAARLAPIEALLADPAMLAAVEVAIHESTHMEPDECECRPEPEDEAAARAALTAVRANLPVVDGADGGGS